MTRQGYTYNNYYCDNKKKNKMLVEIQHVYAKAATEEIQHRVGVYMDCVRRSVQ